MNYRYNSESISVIVQQNTLLNIRKLYMTIPTHIDVSNTTNRPRGSEGSTTNMISPILKSRFAWKHFFRAPRTGMYSFNHRALKCFTRTVSNKLLQVQTCHLFVHAGNSLESNPHYLLGLHSNMSMVDYSLDLRLL